MADYKQDLLKVKQRSRVITITNEFRQVPTIEFVEEVVVFTYGEIISKTKPQLSNLREAMTDPTQTFNLYNPDTNEIVGTSTYANVYFQLYGLYMSLATIRDTPVVVPEPPLVAPVDGPPLEPTP